METTPEFEGLYGTQQLEDIQDAIVAAIKAQKAAIADGSYGAEDLIYLMPLSKPGINAIQGLKDTHKEYLDLFNSEAETLIDGTVIKAIDVGIDGDALEYVRQGANIVFRSGIIARLVLKNKGAGQAQA